MGSEITISAVVPVYNVEDYLADCLESIAKQTVPFHEVIMVNDGSTDSSGKICREYCERYDYFKLINQKNAGPSEARNTGIRVSKSDYIIFIDSDDLVLEDMLLKIKDTLKNAAYDVLFYNASVCYEERTGETLNYFKMGRYFYGRDMKGMDYLYESFPGNYIVSPCIAAYKRKFIQDNDICFPKGVYFEDNAFCLETYIMAGKIRCIDEVLYMRRCRAGSIMSDINSYKKCRDLIQVNFDVYDVLGKSEINNRFRIHMVSYYLINTWKRLRESDFTQEIIGEWKHLLDVFCSTWLHGYLSEDMELGDMLALLIYYNGCGKGKLMDAVKLKERVKAALVQKIKRIPLADADKTKGIYGIGRHTERMLELYEKYVGEMKGNVFFIVTENSGKQLDYKGYPVTTYDHIPKDTGQVIISSLTYRNDMLEQLEKAGIKEKKIYEMYESNEYCDLLTITDILGLDQNGF